MDEPNELDGIMSINQAYWQLHGHTAPIHLPAGIADTLAEAGFEQPNIKLSVPAETIYVPDGEHLILQSDQRRIEELEAQLQQARAWAKAWKIAATSEYGCNLDWQAAAYLAMWHEECMREERDALQAQLDGTKATLMEVHQHLHSQDLSMETMGVLPWTP